MASYLLLLICLVTAILLDETLGSDSRNFPLDNCTTGEIDILELYFMDLILQEGYTKNLLSDDKNMSRVRYAKVIDGFHFQNNKVNVRSWSFQSMDESPNPYTIDDEPSMYLQSKTTQEVMGIKMKFVQHLFSEMRGVRKNATQVAIIFIDYTHFSGAEIRNISHIGNQENTTIKIYVALISDRYKQKIIHLNDSMIFPILQYKSMNNIKDHLYMAMCELCGPGWFPYKHKNESVDLLSCYEVLNLTQSVHHYSQVGLAASIETLDELYFLQTNLYRRIKVIRNTTGYTNDSFQVFLGLARDTHSIARRFKWFDKLDSQGSVIARPVKVTHWMPGKPDSGFYKNCAVWQFTDVEKDVAHVSSSYEERVVEGWVDVPCNYSYFEAFYLSEIVLPRRLENIIRIKPANTESFNKALKKGDFMKWGDNIVSPSTHVASRKFSASLKATKSDFPVFDCGDDAHQPRNISYTFVCDNVDHCTNKRDEMSCVKPADGGVCTCDSAESDGLCTGKICSDGSCLHLQWLNDGEIDCIFSQNVSDENVVHNFYLGRNETCAFICNKGKTCVYLSQLNDERKDCTGSGGPLDETIGKLEPANTCCNLLGDVIWAPKCVYIKDRYGAVVGCRNMSHLQNCLDYECKEGYVKCYNSYCIPQQYVLDGNEDCPAGEEEYYFQAGSCSGSFACWDSKVCLHPDLVCNGYPDCPNKDDELNCDVQCPDGFRCVSGTVTVRDYNIYDKLTTLDIFDNRTRYLDLSGLDLSRLITFNNVIYLPLNAFLISLSNCSIHNVSSRSFDNVKLTNTFDMSHNLLHNFTDMRGVLPDMRHLNLSYNTNLVLVKNLHFSKLELLDLSHTGLKHLDESLFRRLPNLRHLNVSFTFISDFYTNSLHSHFTLHTLDLRGIPIENFYEDLFSGLTIIENLYTDKFEICCPQIRGTQIPFHTCHAPEDAISSCFDLIGVDVQRVLLWVVAVFAVLGNMTVIVYRVIWDRLVLRTGYGLFVTNLGISDLIMGIYLFIIAGTDYCYGNKYVLYHKNWRESVVCKIAGFLATLSCETSKLFILLITLDRFLIIKFPFGQLKFSKLSTRIAILLSWCTGFVLSLIPTVFKFDIYSSNAMCVGLPLTDQRLRGWEWSTHLECSSCLIFFYVSLLLMVK